MFPWRILCGCLLALAGVAWSGIWLYGWLTPRTIDPSGGLYFFGRTEIPVPLFLQGDARWGNESLAKTEGTLSGEGCAVSSAAMILASYGVDTDPKRLNDALNANGGYTPEGWLCWEKAAELDPAHVRFVYEDKPSYALIDRNLLRGNPVIVRIRFQSGITHFVVICGKEGFRYLIRDPGSRGADGVYPLAELGRPIEALRFYERVQ